MTRKEIVKALRECSNGNMNCSKCPMWDAKIDLRCMDFAMKCAADMLEQGAPGWISVKDRLPELGEQVLLIAYGWSDTTIYLGRLEHMSSETSWLTGITSKESEWRIQGWSYLKEPLVTHWMPLPEPPKEEEK